MLRMALVVIDGDVGELLLLVGQRPATPSLHQEVLLSIVGRLPRPNAASSRGSGHHHHVLRLLLVLFTNVMCLVLLLLWLLLLLVQLLWLRLALQYASVAYEGRAGVMGVRHHSGLWRRDALKLRKSC